MRVLKVLKVLKILKVWTVLQYYKYDIFEFDYQLTYNVNARDPVGSNNYRKLQKFS